MITYSTNWMGPINLHWIKEFGDCWATGRIDVNDGTEYGTEMSLPPMHVEDWNTFSEWLDTVETMSVWPLKELADAYEFRNKPIKWLKNDIT